MVTIYFDKQLYSHLFKAKEEKYSVLREKILSHKNEFIFLYSNAHLFDLQQDTTDMKYEEMDFIQSIVNGNHLIYRDDNIVVETAPPRFVFNNVAKMDDFSWIDNFDFSQMTKDQRKFVNNIVDIATKDLTGKLDFDWLKNRTPICSEKLLVDKTTFISLLRFIVYNFYENRESYKTIRDNAIAKYNPTMITADSENVFNAQLLSTPLELSLIDTIKAIQNQIGVSALDNATIYNFSYMFLDLLGISKESRKKVKFRNMQTDGIHSFFGSFCDCIVSDDIGMLNKSKALYRLFKIGTQVYSIDEFIEKFDDAINNNQKSASKYLDEVRADYERREVVKTETIKEYTYTNLRSSHKYFGYFNCMLEKTSKDEIIIMLHKNNDVNQPILIQEIEIIVNRFVRTFNGMGTTFSLFDKELELPQIKADNWNRVFVLNNTEMCLTKFKGTPMLCFYIKLKKTVQQTRK